MKKILSLCMVFCLLTNLFPVAVNAEDNSESEITKRLVQVNQKSDDYGVEYKFAYNDQGELSSKTYSTSNGFSNITNFLYDEEGRYIQYESNGKVYDVYKYDTSGNLISYMERYGDHWWDYTYYYDQGVLRSAKCVDVMGGETEITYETNDQNKVVKMSERELMNDGTYQTTTRTYLYDDAGRKIQEIYKYPEGRNVTIKYDYSKMPFVYSGSNLWIEDKMGHKIWDLVKGSYYQGELSIKTDDNGYVISAENDYSSWKFIYEDTPEIIDLHLDFTKPNYEAYQDFMKNDYDMIIKGETWYEATLQSIDDNWWTPNWAINMASWILDEDLSVERCLQILCSLASLMNSELQDSINNQANFDTTKTLLDYGADLAGIATGAIGVNVDLTKGADVVLKTISTAGQLTDSLLGVTVSTMDDIALLNQILGDYRMHYSFLNSIATYAEEDNMREAAKILMDVNKTILENKLLIFNEAGEKTANFLAKDIFYDQLAQDILSDPGLFNEGAEKYLAQIGSVAIAATGYAELAFDITLMAGDFLFETTDTYNRYNEMKAIKIIKNALVHSVEENVVLNEEDIDLLCQNASIMKMIKYVDFRGEYCCYKLTSEGGLLSTVKDTKADAQETYNSAILAFELSLGMINEIFISE